MARIPENLWAMMLTPLLCPNYTATNLEIFSVFWVALVTGRAAENLYEKRAAEKPAESVLLCRRF